ncbi:type VI secretion system baseplate subunit TssG [Shinella sp. JR1-6]|jgi:type VI secretion system protein ImpH|uniref:type VI secretion system baseplate subunit TssG n=1 Tax=Shinella sp. JR1-6 TaxID=2527671 RepID=UPI00102D5E0A|nr:type VI secretion system baseplate subunit TssG [Shinella sp. JR1-6]TAA60123.1 type VI secretion system baseplate subunit TssG [Shinella sp. JR1-6]
MAGTGRRSNSSLVARAFDGPQAFELFQMIRILEALGAEEGHDTAHRPVDPVGQGVDPERAAVKIRSSVPLGFASAEVLSVRRPRSGGPVEMTQTLVGLTGPSGVLPHAMSELVQMSVRERNFALREFFDVFNNRLSGLLYNAWAKYRPAIERERAAQLSTAAPIDHALKSLVGLGLPAMTDRTRVGDHTFVFFGGLLARQGRSAVAIEQALAGALGHTLRVEQFAGEWYPIAPSDRTQLPDRTRPRGAFARLGDDAVIGTKTFDIQSTVTLRVEGLDYPAFRSLLPDGSRARLLTDLAASALGADKMFNIRLELKPDHVPALRLGGQREDAKASRLGWNTWLQPARPRQQPAAVQFRPPPHLR